MPQENDPLIMQAAVTAAVTVPKTITFNNDDGEKVGELSWENDVFKFEGEAEESARIFFKFIQDMMGDAKWVNR